MKKFEFLYLNKKSFLTFFALFFIAVLAIGGCSDGGNGGVNGSDTSACTVLSEPCSIVTEFLNVSPPYVECVVSDTTCAVNLENVISQVKARNINVSDSSILWMGAWGGDGGSAAENGGPNTNGGYAQSTSSVLDIKNRNNEQSSIIYYFLGAPGGNAPGHCGGGGGASTIVTFEDLTLNPSSNPTQSLVQMIAGGGGGSSGGTIKGCSTPRGTEGGNGGVAIAGTGSNVSNAGDGCNNENNCASGSCSSNLCTFIAEGGGTNGDSSGTRACCVNKQTRPTDGTSGLGGLGGKGGKGTKCTAVGGRSFRNANFLSFTAGSGGDGGGGDNACTSGGGGGGGGYGGGGAGGLGNNDHESQSGGGGGSFSVMSTQSTSIAPSSRPQNPCGTSGCLTISVIED